MKIVRDYFVVGLVMDYLIFDYYIMEYALYLLINLSNFKYGNLVNLNFINYFLKIFRLTLNYFFILHFFRQLFIFQNFVSNQVETHLKKMVIICYNLSLENLYNSNQILGLKFSLNFIRMRLLIINLLYLFCFIIFDLHFIRLDLAKLRESLGQPHSKKDYNQEV